MTFCDTWTPSVRFSNLNARNLPLTTIDTVLILAGGKGTRSLDPNTPKINQVIADGVDVVSVLLYQLARLEPPQTIWVVHHKAEEVLRRLMPLPNSHKVVVDTGEGTSLAVHSALEKIRGTRVMILLGDCLLGAPLKEVVDSIESSGATYFFGRLTNHPNDSDLLSVDAIGNVKKFIAKSVESRDRDRSQSELQYGLSGMTITTLDVLQSGVVHNDLQHNIFAKARELGKSVRLIKNSWYVRDTGTPSRLKRAQTDYLSGSFHRRSAVRRAALFLDRDGTLIENLGEARKSIKRGEVPESIVEEIKIANELGIPVLIVSNQPGIAKGMISLADLDRVNSDLFRAFNGAFFDDFYFCPHHPEQGWEGEIPQLKTECDCRKPRPGMLLRASREHLINLEQSILIGDSEADARAARSAKTGFISASWSPNGEDVSSAIRTAVQRMTSDSY